MVISVLGDWDKQEAFLQHMETEEANIGPA